jgi:redox-sensitive bicupin YhaK (pirin superfamily)
MPLPINIFLPSAILDRFSRPAVCSPVDIGSIGRHVLRASYAEDLVNPARSPEGETIGKADTMIIVRRAETRRHILSDVQESWLSFDPLNPADVYRHGFHALESLSEEAPLPGMTLQRHGDADLDVVTYVREGLLVRQDERGRLNSLRSGDFDRTSASGKVHHRVINGSLLNPAHIFQSGILPDGGEFEPGIEQKRFPVAEREGVLRLVASPDGREGSLRLHQDVRMYSSILLPGRHLVHELGPGRAAWFHLVKGRVLLMNHYLGTGDAASLELEASVSFTAQVPSETLLFDLA